MIDFEEMEFRIVEGNNKEKFLEGKLQLFVLMRIPNKHNPGIGILKDTLRQEMWHKIYDQPARKIKMI